MQCRYSCDIPVLTLQKDMFEEFMHSNSLYLSIIIICYGATEGGHLNIGITYSKSLHYNSSYRSMLLSTNHIFGNFGFYRYIVASAGIHCSFYHLKPKDHYQSEKVFIYLPYISHVFQCRPHLLLYLWCSCWIFPLQASWFLKNGWYSIWLQAWPFLPY